MDLHLLLLNLERLGVKFLLEGDQLHFRAPAGVMSDELRRKIGTHKSSLMDLMGRSMRLSAEGSSRRCTDDDLPLPPHFEWYINTFEPERHTWAITLAWDFSERISVERLRAAVGALLRRHDVFRLRMRRTTAGHWSLRMLEHAGEARVDAHDMENLSPEKRAGALHDVGLRLQSELSIVTGPVFAVALCRCGHSNGDTVILSMHHHMVDAYSVNLLLEDLARLYQAPVADDFQEKPASSSYREFLLELHAYTHTPMLVARALSFWYSGRRLRPVAPLPVDMPGGCHTDLNSRVFSMRLDREVLRNLLRHISPRYQLKLNDLLLIALANAYSRWSGGCPLRLDIEHNGRSGIIPGLELARTVGPTTIKFPLLLAIDRADTLPESLERLSSQIDETTDNLLGYGLLRYTCPDANIRHTLAACGAPQVFFNNRAIGIGRSSTPEARSVRGMAFPQPGVIENLVSYDLMVECENFEDTLELRWCYSSAIHREDSIRALAQCFAEFLSTLVTADVP